MTKIKEFIHKNKKIIIVVLAFCFVKCNYPSRLENNTHSKDEEISPSTQINNSTENNQQDINDQPNTNPNTVQRQFSDGTVIVYNKVTENIIKKYFLMEQFKNMIPTN